MQGMHRKEPCRCGHGKTIHNPYPLETQQEVTDTVQISRVRLPRLQAEEDVNPLCGQAETLDDLHEGAASWCLNANWNSCD
jgi:hypothetical protein